MNIMNIIPKSKHHPFFKPTHLCLNCGEPVMYVERDAVVIHEWNRFQESDNGYWCNAASWYPGATSATIDKNRPVKISE